MPTQSSPGSNSVLGSPRERRGFVITTTTPRDGAGTSTFALNLAAALASQVHGLEQRVVILDATVGRSDLAQFFGVYVPSVEDVVGRQDSLGPSTVGEYLVHESAFHLSALLGPVTAQWAGPGSPLTPELYTRIVDALRQHFDYVVIDTPPVEPRDPMFAKFALAVADYVVCHAAADPTHLEVLDMWMGSACAAPEFGGQGFDPAKVGFVVSQSDPALPPASSRGRREFANRCRYLGTIPYLNWRRSSSLPRLAVREHPEELLPVFRSILAPVIGDVTWQPGVPAPSRRGRFGRAKTPAEE